MGLMFQSRAVNEASLFIRCQEELEYKHTHAEGEVTLIPESQTHPVNLTTVASLPTFDLVTHQTHMISSTFMSH